MDGVVEAGEDEMLAQDWLIHNEEDFSSSLPQSTTDGEAPDTPHRSAENKDIVEGQIQI